MISPHGSSLVDLKVSENEAHLLSEQLKAGIAITLSKRQLCDLELLINGSYSPLTGFMCRGDYENVLDSMMLKNGFLWSIPVMLDVSHEIALNIEIGDKIGLLDEEGFALAAIQVEDKWRIDKEREAEKIYSGVSREHPGVSYLYKVVGDYYIGGRVSAFQFPIHYDFEDLRRTPSDVRSKFTDLGWHNVIAFSTGKPMHRVHKEFLLNAAMEAEANILVHPIVGLDHPGNLEYFSRVHCYQAIMNYFPSNMSMLALLPYSTRMAGPREAIHSAIIRQNYGCSHIVIGPEHGAPPDTRQGGKRFYESYSSYNLAIEKQDALEIKIIGVEEQCYIPSQGKYVPLKSVNDDQEKRLQFRDSELHDMLVNNKEIPDWFTYPEVVEALKKVVKPRSECGLTLFFTGLSGSGKSTLAKLLYARFIEEGTRPVTLLDGDVVRHHLSSELGFSKEHRDLNVKRIGYVASEINKNAGIAICAPIAPYSDIRQYVRDINTQYGAFIEIHVATPLDVCEKRDRKGLYAKARRGEIKQFTGISDPYEEPETPDIRIDTSEYTPAEASQQIMLFLYKEGYVV